MAPRLMVTSNERTREDSGLKNARIVPEIPVKNPTGIIARTTTPKNRLSDDQPATVSENHQGTSPKRTTAHRLVRLLKKVP